MDRDWARIRSEAIGGVEESAACEATGFEATGRFAGLARLRRQATWLAGRPEVFWSAHASDDPDDLRALAERECAVEGKRSGTGVCSGGVAEMLGSAREALVRLRCLDDRRVDAALRIYDAVADAWADRHDSTREQWYTTHIAGFVVGGSHVAARLPFDDAAQVKGATAFLDSGLAIVYAFEHCDISTLAHEAAHLFRRDLEGEDLLTVEAWLGVEGGRWEGGRYAEGRWTPDAEERFARAFERYLLEGVAPTPELEPVFATIRRHL